MLTCLPSAPGNLPPSWGRNGTFANLKALILEENELQGTLPAAWAQPASFLSLVHLDVSSAPCLLCNVLVSPNHGLPLYLKQGPSSTGEVVSNKIISRCCAQCCCLLALEHVAGDCERSFWIAT